MTEREIILKIINKLDSIKNDLFLGLKNMDKFYICTMYKRIYFFNRKMNFRFVDDETTENVMKMHAPSLYKLIMDVGKKLNKNFKFGNSWNLNNHKSFYNTECFRNAVQFKIDKLNELLEEIDKNDKEKSN